MGRFVGHYFHHKGLNVLTGFTPLTVIIVCVIIINVTSAERWFEWSSADLPTESQLDS